MSKSTMKRCNRFPQIKSINIRATITHQVIKPISTFIIHTFCMALILVFDCSNICAFWVWISSANTYSDPRGATNYPEYTSNGMKLQRMTFLVIFDNGFSHAELMPFFFIRPTFGRFRNQIALHERVFPLKLSHNVLPSAYVLSFSRL